MQGSPGQAPLLVWMTPPQHAAGWPGGASIDPLPLFIDAGRQAHSAQGPLLLLDVARLSKGGLEGLCEQRGGADGSWVGEGVGVP